MDYYLWLVLVELDTTVIKKPAPDDILIEPIHLFAF